jgi:hypothetical protein
MVAGGAWKKQYKDSCLRAFIRMLKWAVDHKLTTRIRWKESSGGWMACGPVISRALSG